ncbi:MAG TPA: hypothetical protein PLF25_09925 [Accumulibacter sp.]|nr:hypothetical protein [Accumulibacter sp.]
MREIKSAEIEKNLVVQMREIELERQTKCSVPSSASRSGSHARKRRSPSPTNQENSPMPTPWLTRHVPKWSEPWRACTRRGKWRRLNPTKTFNYRNREETRS